VRPICIIDTTIFCEILQVPHKSNKQKATKVREELIAKSQSESLLLPMTTVLETGNHIGQNGDGTLRRKAAQRFVDQVKKALDGAAPFVVTPMLDRARLVALLETFPDWVQQKSGLGDLTIRDVFDQQCKLSPNRLVYIWSMDTHLQGYRREP
jgi:hypothetical protein